MNSTITVRRRDIHVVHRGVRLDGVTVDVVYVLRFVCSCGCRIDFGLRKDETAGRALDHRSCSDHRRRTAALVRRYVDRPERPTPRGIADTIG